MKPFHIISMSLLFLLLAIGTLRAQEVTHTVQRGETLSSIAGKYGVTVDKLKEANPTTKSYVYVGMKLIIPQAAGSKQAVDKTQKSQGNRSIKEQKVPQKAQVPKVEKSKQKTYKYQSERGQISEGENRKELIDGILSLQNASYASIRAFYIPISYGFGLGMEVSDILGIPIGIGASYWNATYKADNISIGGSVYDMTSSIKAASIFLTYCQRFYLGGIDLYISPNSGIELDMPQYYLSDAKVYNASKLGLRFNPTVGYQIINGLSAEIGFLGTLYAFKSFGCNMTLGVSYRF